MDFLKVFCYTSDRDSKKGGYRLKKIVQKWKNAILFADFWVFFASSLLLVSFVVLEIQMHFFREPWLQSTLLRAVLLALICLLFYLWGVLYAGRTQKKSILKYLMLFFFALYLYLLLNITLIDKGLGRQDRLVTREEYLKNYLNLIPFRSIYEVYIVGFIKGYVNAYYMLLNLLGNICVLMPLSYFLPLFFRRLKKWYLFFVASLLCTVTLELLQFWWMVGSCDIDDILLNVGGAMLFYGILKIPSVQKVSSALTRDTSL